jgi:hypothetical protein
MISGSKPLHLVKVMIGHNAHSGGKVEAANLSPYGHGKTGVGLSDIRGQTRGLLPEKQVTAGVYFRLCVDFGPMAAENDQPAPFFPLL